MLLPNLTVRPLCTANVHLDRHRHDSCDNMDQAFRIRFCIPQNMEGFEGSDYFSHVEGKIVCSTVPRSWRSNQIASCE